MPCNLTGRFAALIGAVALALPAILLAGEVSLTGEGSVKYTPDSARLQFTAASEHKSADKATGAVNEKITAWNEAVSEYKARMEDYSDASLTLYTRNLPVGERNEKPEQRAVASQSVSFVIKDMTLLNPLISAAQKLGMEYNLGAHQFFHSDENGLHQQALGRAIADARGRCAFVAGELEKTCGEIKTINVNGGGRPVPMMMAETRSDKGAVSEVGPREIQISVSATFELD
ncbi:MAG: SIMPL domain-containing protein [Marinobacter sp.]|uniref:SIMPL domain-containing protein n=1 Tax=Marinobacter sp. TaxID=50741 RepID=UPI0034A04515